jgi:ureidoglycolate lyase/seryl-tRNA synthetase
LLVLPETMDISAPKYLFYPKEKPSLPLHDIPVVTATDSSVEPFGLLVDDPNSVDVEIVRWPA